ncbi:MAG: TraM recognition domain-containing protein [Planctomycetes bacterium]|nr:TraM recognition domain-containing protein [Planctomycetota bacterium]
MPDLYRLVVSAPSSSEEFRSPGWQAKSFCFSLLRAAESRSKNARQSADFDLIADYFAMEWPRLAEKTRSVVLSTFTSMADVLQRGILRDKLCSGMNVTPDVVEEGKILLLDFPILEFGEVGRIAQCLFKYSFERAMERRDVRRNPRPVFLFADEAQFFLIPSHDMQFQTTCRSARVATVYLTQNLSNMYAALGGDEKARHEADSLVANLSTKVFHASDDPVTNEWASRLVGRSLQYFASGGSSRPDTGFSGGMMGFGTDGDEGSSNAGFSESYEADLQPSVFTHLKTGGSQNGWVVEGVVVQRGREFQTTGKSWMITEFPQDRGHAPSGGM